MVDHSNTNSIVDVCGILQIRLPRVDPTLVRRSWSASSCDLAQEVPDVLCPINGASLPVLPPKGCHLTAIVLHDILWRFTIGSNPLFWRVAKVTGQGSTTLSVSHGRAEAVGTSWLVWRWSLPCHAEYCCLVVTSTCAASRIRERKSRVIQPVFATTQLILITRVSSGLIEQHDK